MKNQLLALVVGLSAILSATGAFAAPAEPSPDSCSLAYRHGYERGYQEIIQGGWGEPNRDGCPTSFAEGMNAGLADGAAQNAHSVAPPSLVGIPVRDTGTYMIYRHPMGQAPGVKARIVSVDQYKNHLFVYNEFNHGPQLISYLTVAGAQEDAERILAGGSIDITDCVTKDSLLTSIKSANGFCDQRRYSAQIQCGRFNRVSFTDGLDFEAYVSSDVTKNTLEISETRCLNEHPQP